MIEYGLGIAAQADEKHANIINVICTPISSHKDHPGFDVLRDQQLRFSFDMNNTLDVMRGFVTLTNYIQKYRDLHPAEFQLPLFIGDHNGHPVNGDALFTQLFGKRAKPKASSDDIQLMIYNYIQAAECLGDPFESLSEITDHWKRYVEEKISWKGYAIDFESKLREKLEKYESVVTSAEEARAQFFKDKTPYPDGFVDACRKFSKLMKQSVLAWGSYSPPVILETGQEQSKKDLLLLSLKPKMHDPAVHQQLIEIARNEGEYWAHRVNLNPAIFSLSNSLPNYTKDKALQEKHPEYSFYYWHKDYEAAFHESFKANYTGQYPRHLKLYLDPPNPPYTDPCFDLMVGQRLIRQGQIAHEDAEDEPKWRQDISNTASKTAILVSRSTRNGGWSSRETFFKTEGFSPSP